MSINKKIASKLNTSAFTLAETLVAIMIMLMVSLVVATGMPAARNAYENVIKSANSEVLLSTTISTLRNELGTAKEIKTKNDNTITYYNTAIGSMSRISLGSYTFTTGRGKGKTKNNTVLYVMNAKSDMVDDASVKEKDPELLMSEQISTGDLYVTFTKVEYDSDKKIVKFTGLTVKDITNDKTLTGRDLSIRVVS